MSEKLQRFYKSEAWENFRQIVIANRTRDDGVVICEHCGTPILKKYDCILHHIEELTDDNVDDVSVSLNEDNIKLVHFGCHNKLHRRANNDRAGVGFTSKHVYLVWGSPCAGKKYWVNSVMECDDVIVDIDKLWAAVRWSGCDASDKPWQLKDIVFGLRDCLLDMIKVRRGNWHNAYIIGGYALEGERHRICEALGVDRDIFIECDKSICLERAKEKGDKWIEYVEQWWDRYTPPPSSR